MNAFHSTYIICEIASKRHKVCNLRTVETDGDKGTHMDTGKNAPLCENVPR